MASTDNLAKQVEQLSQLVEVSRSIAAQLDLEPLLQRIVDTATQLAGAKMGALLVLEEDKQGIQYFKVSGWPYHSSSTPTAAGVLGLPYRCGVPVRVDDVRLHPEAVGLPADHPQLQAFLSVPLISKEQTLGALYVSNEVGYPSFSQEDEDLLMAFATQAAIAIQNARLYAKAEELARLQERQRIAQTLHEVVAQLLFRVGIETDWCLKNLSLEPESQQRLQVIHRLSGRASSEIRSAIFALHSPYLLVEGGLSKLLQDLLAEFEARHKISTTLTAPAHLPPLPPQICEAVFRIAHEALANVYKHARASAVMVSLLGDADSFTLIVQDNGVGLNQAAETESDEDFLHFGVATMRRLTRQAQGDFLLANNDDGGVMVKARFPLTVGEKLWP